MVAWTTPFTIGITKCWFQLRIYHQPPTGFVYSFPNQPIVDPQGLEPQQTEPKSVVLTNYTKGHKKGQLNSELPLNFCGAFGIRTQVSRRDNNTSVSHA